MDFLAGDSVWVYVIIFFGKLVEVSIDTLRVVVVNRGKKFIATVLAFFDMLIWVFIVSSVLNGLSDDIVKAIIYAISYALGNFTGMLIEQKLAMGLCSLQVIARESEGYKLANALREGKFGVTTLEGDSFNYKRQILIIHLKRKRINEALKLIKSIDNDCVVTVNDIKTVHGGFVKSK